MKRVNLESIFSFLNDTTYNYVFGDPGVVSSRTENWIGEISGNFSRRGASLVNSNWPQLGQDQLRGSDILKTHFAGYVLGMLFHVV